MQVEEITFRIFLSVDIWCLLMRMAIGVLANDITNGLSFAPVIKTHSVGGCNEMDLFKSAGGNFTKLFNALSQPNVLLYILVKQLIVCIFDALKGSVVSRRIDVF